MKKSAPSTCSKLDVVSPVTKARRSSSPGAGAVTQLFSKSFKSVHAIDVSQSMLSTFSTELPSDKYPNVTHSLHTLSSSSPGEFAGGSMKSPVEGDPDRVVSLPRSKWDVAAVILVLHHVDDIEGFMTGLTGLVEDGGWVVFSEFTNLGQGHKVSFLPEYQYPY
jgi:hypothetical protein